MGPIEFVFIPCCWSSQHRRGARRVQELGVTNMILIGLLLIKLLETQFVAEFATLLQTTFGSPPDPCPA